MGLIPNKTDTKEQKKDSVHESGYAFKNGMIQLVDIDKAMEFRGMKDQNCSSKYTPPKKRGLVDGKK